MDIFIPLGGVVATAPITAWAAHSTYNAVVAGQASMHLVLLTIAVLIQLHFINTLRFALRARSLGCGPPTWYPHKDPILGLDLFAANRRAFAARNLQDALIERYKYVGAHTYTMKLLGIQAYITEEPENIKAILSHKFDDWAIAGPRLDAALPLLREHSVFASNGPVWHAARSMLRPSFVRDQVADLKCFGKHVGYLLEHLERGEAETVGMTKLFSDMTMDSSTDFLLGYSTDTLVRASPDAEQFVQDFEMAAERSAMKANMGRLLWLLPDKELWRSVEGARGYVRRYLKKAIAEGIEKEKERSYVFLHELIKTGASEEDLLGHIMSIMLAGRDTTAAALTASFWYLARAPDVVAKMRQEIEEVGTEIPSWEQLKDMKYMNKVVKEVLRLFPPAPSNSRSAVRDTVLPRGGGPDGSKPLLIAKGQNVRYTFYSLYRRKDIFGQDADEFRPERWDNLRVNWEYTPFSGGPRICIGQQFALTQILYTLYRVFWRYKAIIPAESGPIVPRNMLTMSITNKCLVKFTPA